MEKRACETVLELTGEKLWIIGSWGGSWGGRAERVAGEDPFLHCFG